MRGYNDAVSSKMSYDDTEEPSLRCNEKIVFFVLLPIKSRLSFSDIADVVELRADIHADSSAHITDFFTYRRIIREVSPDIVHTHGATVARLAAKSLGIPTVMTRHCAYPVKLMNRFPFKQMNSAVYTRFTDFCIATANAAAKNLTDMGVPSEKIRVIINGVPKQKIISQDEKSKIKSLLGCEGYFIVGSVARLEKEKGHKTIIDAARLLQNERIRFLFFGDGRLDSELKEYAKGLDNVIFCGFKSDIFRYMNIFDISVNASCGTETSCLALSESMSLGIPCIASDYGGNPYMVSECGLVFPCGDARALSERIIRVYRDRELYKSLSEKSQIRYEKDFTVDGMQREYNEVYKYVLGKAHEQRIK